MIIIDAFTGRSDLNLITPSRTFAARTTMRTQPVTFTLVLDSIAQEFNEDFTLSLNYDRSLFQPNDSVTFIDELRVTIIDDDGRFKNRSYIHGSPILLIVQMGYILATPLTKILEQPLCPQGCTHTERGYIM